MNKTVAAIAIIVILAIGGLALANKNNNKTNTSTTTTPNTSSQATNTPEDNSSNSSAQSDGTITYSANGFSPVNLTVKSGATITVKNTSSTSLDFDSDPHPQHTDNPELNAGIVAPGQSKTFTLITKG